MTEKLTSAIMIAAEAHENQTDKNGAPYILHPLRVMLAMEDETHMIVAVLHDVAEDFAFGWSRIHEVDFSDEILDAVDALTRREDEGYDDFIKRAAANEIARKVKIADIRDNLRPGAASLRSRYEKALAYLKNYERNEG